MKLKLSSPIEVLPIPKKYKKELRKLKLEKVGDLLFYFPQRYEDYSNLKKIKDLKIGEKVSIQGKIKEIENIISPLKKRVLTEALVEDETGSLRVVWFNQPFLKNYFKRGDKVSLSGKVSSDSFYPLYLSSPYFEKIKPHKTLIHTGRVISFYSETKGISSKLIRWLIFLLLKEFKEKLPETLPEEILKKAKLLTLREAIEKIHFPAELKEAKKAKLRFQFEELFLLHLSVLKERLALEKEKAFKIEISSQLLERFKESLPFKLTLDQEKCIKEIVQDLSKETPMNRLLQGDVGSGKTAVAAFSALATIKAGYQVALMAPTEILSKQHFQEIHKLLAPFRVEIGLLTGKQDKLLSKKLPGQTIEISRKKLLEKTLSGDLDLLIGTHALIQEKVKFGNLALVILDEQHRFGVKQRAKLLKQGKASSFIPHLLSMTATPIPRTLALTIYGDLDISIIEKPPPGRKPAITQLVEPEERFKVYEFLRKEIKKGKQLFVICPKIEPKEGKLAHLKSVEKEYEFLKSEVFPEFKVAKLHGKMKTSERDKVIQEFREGKIQILVATSVVEVGIDVPQATLMIIEGAERFGLAQLHQFRGRIQRSKEQAFCFLFVSGNLSEKAKKRLQALLSTKSGLELAEIDLKLRGPGSFLGARQWGMPDLAMSALANQKLVKRTKEIAQEILTQDPELKKYPVLAKRIKKFKEIFHKE